MKRRRSIKSLETLVEHPPEQCRKLMSSKVLNLLDEIARQQAAKESNSKPEAREP